MTTQQRIWLYASAIVRSIRPLLLYLFIPALLSSIGKLLFANSRTVEEFLKVSGNFYHFIGLVVVFLILRKNCKRRNEDFFQEVTLYLDNIQKQKLILLFLGGLLCGVAISAVLTIIPFPEWFLGGYQERTSDVYSNADTMLAILSTVFVAPVVEEIIYRGYMLNRLLRKIPQSHAIIISSTVFGLCHIAPVWVLYAFAMGMILAYISIKEDNILHAIVFHLGFNFFTLPVWLINGNEGASELLFGSNILVFLYGVIAVLGIIIVYKTYCRRYLRG